MGRRGERRRGLGRFGGGLGGGLGVPEARPRKQRQKSKNDRSCHVHHGKPPRSGGETSWSFISPRGMTMSTAPVKPGPLMVTSSGTSATLVAGIAIRPSGRN